MANTSHEPTKETKNLVKLCAIVGTQHKEIAIALGISLNTLKKHYKAELITALLQANATVAGRLYKQTEDNVVACIFWLKTKAGWRENNPIDQNIAPVKLSWKEDE